MELIIIIILAIILVTLLWIFSIKYYKLNKLSERLYKLVSDAILHQSVEVSYDETKISALEEKMSKYFEMQKVRMEKIEKEQDSFKSLISDISHQTKTPVASLLLYAGLLSESVSNTNEIEAVKEINIQSEKLYFLMDSLVKMSCMETGIIHMRPEKGDISELIDHVISLALAETEKKDISIKFENKMECYCYYDLKWTSEAVFNVLDNAIKYSKDHSSIEISLTEIPNFVSINITDEGIGMDEEEINHIFKRFFRSKRVHQKEGVGIGLYLTREIITKQGGYIRVKSKIGVGSTFTINLYKKEFIIKNV